VSHSLRLSYSGTPHSLSWYSRMRGSTPAQLHRRWTSLWPVIGMAPAWDRGGLLRVIGLGSCRNMRSHKTLRTHQRPAECYDYALRLRSHKTSGTPALLFRTRANTK